MDPRDLSRSIEKALLLVHHERHYTFNMLFVPTSHCGMNTIIKHLSLASRSGDAKSLEAQATRYIHLIHKSIIKSGKLLSSELSLLEDAKLEEEVQVAQKALSEASEHEPVSAVLAWRLDTLWKCSVARELYEKLLTQSKQRLQLGGFDYWMSRLFEVVKSSYVPSQEDVFTLQTHQASDNVMGVREFVVRDEYGGFNFHYIVMPRNSSTTPKWIHCFENVPVVLFLASLDNYDQYRVEGDEKVNILQESIKHFHQVANSRWFRKSCKTVFLTKRDLFAAKLLKVPFTDHFPEYKGTNTYEEVLQWIDDRFRSPESVGEVGHNVALHAIDASEERLQTVFKAVQELLRERVLFKEDTERRLD